jgi:hypothetical protein
LDARPASRVASGDVDAAGADVGAPGCNPRAPRRIQFLDTGTFRSRRMPMLASAIVMLFSVSLWFVKQFDEPVW